MIWEIDQPEDRPDGVDAMGRPDPAYAAALGLVRAPFGRRSLAFLLDILIWASCSCRCGSGPSRCS